MKPEARDIRATKTRSFDCIRGLAFMPELGAIVGLVFAGQLKGWSLYDGERNNRPARRRILDAR